MHEKTKMNRQKYTEISEEFRSKVRTMPITVDHIARHLTGGLLASAVSTVNERPPLTSKYEKE